MKRLVILSLLVLSTIFAPSAYAELNIGKVSKELPPAVFKEISQIPTKPHYLLGLEPKIDEWERFLEPRKIFMTKDVVYGKNGGGMIDKTKDDYRPSNTQLVQKLVLAQKPVHVVYSHHHFTADREQMYVFWAKTGEKNLAEYSPLYRKYEVRWSLGQIPDGQWKNIQRVLGWAQFEAVKAFTVKTLKWAVDKNIKDFTDMNLTEGVLRARAKILDDPDYRKNLDEKVAGTS